MFWLAPSLGTPSPLGVAVKVLPTLTTEQLNRLRVLGELLGRRLNEASRCRQTDSRPAARGRLRAQAANANAGIRAPRD